MVKGWVFLLTTSEKMWVYQDLHATGIKDILISLEMNLGQNSFLYMEKRVTKKLLSLPF